jgi:hypothetical protein
VAGIDLCRFCSVVLMLVLSESVFVLVIESGLLWYYVPITHDLPLNATTLLPLSEQVHEQDNGPNHSHIGNYYSSIP